MSQTAAPSRSPVAKAHGAAVGLPPRRPRSSFPNAYTLIEVMIVAVIVVLMLGMALPVFRVITGSRSEAGASNLIASMLGRARTDAIGLDTPVGVAVVYNPSTQLSYLAEVGFANCPQWVSGQPVAPRGYVCATIGTVNYYFINTGNGVVTLNTAPTTWSSNPQTYVYSVGGAPIDTLPNTDIVPLPTGIGAQTICNTTINASGQRTTDGYLRIGVILFNGSGTMSIQNYGISQYSNLSRACSLGPVDYPTANNTVYTNYQPGVASQTGLVVYQQEAFQNQQSPTPDPAYTDSYASQSNDYTGTGSPTQQAEENWLDQNATPLLIDRYTGTLIKAE